MDSTLKKMFEENQSKLPPERRAATSGQHYCLNQHAGYKCTRAMEHEGNHIAHSTLGYVCHEWTQQEGVAETKAQCLVP